MTDRRASPRRHVDRASEMYDAFRTLSPKERAFVRHALCGDPYDAAAKAVHLRSPLAVLDLLGRKRISDAIQRLAPLIADQEHARSLLAPFALRAHADALRDESHTVKPATKATAAREITSPTSVLDPRNTPARQGAGGPPAETGKPGAETAWARAKREAATRRAALRQAFGIARPEPHGQADRVPPAAADLAEVPDGATALPSTDLAADGAPLPPARIVLP